ncbi:MAG: hypothetical protein K0S61_4744 [Anaerocolumna sp.]|jgi:hypothetical protein|nr:hypothetical protein [Anaerocolumna sp.]
MEYWTEIYKNTIPLGEYQSLVQNGEDSGLLVKLESNHNIVNISFSIVSAFRMLDEGIILGEIFNSNEISRYKKDKFSNTIYKIEEGEFGDFIKKISNGLYTYLDLTHYIIITMNYVIEVISKEEPIIEIIKKNNIYRD